MTPATPVVLLMLALALTGPGPALLARAHWPSRAPRAALVLWQAMALSALLAALGAGLSAATLILVYQNPMVVALHSVALLLTFVVLVRLLWSAHTLGTALRAGRRRQRHLVDLLGRVDERAPGADVLDAGQPLAYCIPGCIPGMPSRVVISTPTIDQLTDDEVHAVLAHERAHARARHDLVLEAFGVLHNAFPRFVRSRTALDVTAGLVEMLADDAARRRSGAVPLARALAGLATSPAPPGTLAATAVTPAARIRRLAHVPASDPLVSAPAYLAAVALVAVPTVAVAVPWLSAVTASLT